MSRIAERITSYHARNNADWVMYREALAAARELGWKVPWQVDHKLAMAAALAAK